jgi:hypothetical protein
LLVDLTTSGVWALVPCPMCAAKPLYLVVQRAQRVETMPDVREHHPRSPIIALAPFAGYRVHKHAHPPRAAVAV